MIGRDRSLPLAERLEALDAAVELADGRLDGHHVADARHVIDKAAERLGHGTDHTLVAFLGATGGGKSSLTNAVVGHDIATTGVRRPTTSSTLACYWGDDDPQPLLQWLEVQNRHHVASGGPLDGLVLLDVPDHDSVESANREEMERIAEHADLLVWVTDSEKYGDKAMHTYLRQLARHGAITALVLNKADQLSPADLEACRTDLRRLLADDGLPDAPVLATSALGATTGPDGEAGPGAGIDELRQLLATAVADRRAMTDRLTADVATVADQLLAGLGPDDGVETVPKRVTERLAADLVEASGLQAVCAAVEAGHKRDASSRTGWPFTRWLRSLRPHPLRRLHLGQGTAGRSSLPQPTGVQRARTEGAVRTAVDAVSGDMGEPWPELLRRAATPDPAELNDRVDQAIAGSVRTIAGDRPRWWQAVNGVQLLLAAATVAGALWLALLAFGAYLRLPEPPTPDYRGIPIPTGLLLGGVLVGLLLALLARRLASVGARRRSRGVRRRAEAAVTDVGRELVVAPMQAELEHRTELHRLLTSITR